MKKRTKKPPTPLEILRAEQKRVRESCRLQEEKLNEDFRFIHRHSGKLLFSGISSLFFSGRRDDTPKEEKEVRDTPMLGAMLKDFSPVLIEAAIPIVLRWGVGRIGRLFKGKK
ncbi:MULTISPECIES: hypothetical protein [Butyricimonas]|uniref:Uncharacterized protein n=1 Tax=Butyricimonas hominis TaxID=2763032 RepID=A0ABR7CXU2_9BACT|nr:MULTISPECIES: hypothetical protein [Butyricimonas]MBC5620493.1 hypothetical protein [Butyricimonas hominis]